MTIYVHRNLNRKCWSVLDRGKLKGYRHKLTMRDVEFRVRAGGQRRAVREKRRNVHAFAVGRMSTGIPYGKGIKVRYDVRTGRFVDFGGRQILEAKKVYFTDQGQVWAFSPTYGERNRT